jgi:hypothetical protein
MSGRAAAAACLCLLTAATPAFAVDVTPFAGWRFGGDLSAQQSGYTSSASINAAFSYGAIIDFPIGGPRSLELYYSREPTTLGGSLATAPITDLTVSVYHLGLAETIQTDNPRLSWLVVGSAGVTGLAAGGNSQTHLSIGAGGAVLYMVSEHVGVRMDLRAFLTFTGGGSGALACNGGCTAQIFTTGFAQGEISLGVVARF